MISLCCFAAFQIRDPIIEVVILISSCGRRLFAYSAVHSCAHVFCGLETYCHHIHAPINVLLCSRSRNHRPPCFFGVQTVSHFTNAHFLFCPVDPHKKLRCRVLIFLSTISTQQEPRRDKWAWIVRLPLLGQASLPCWEFCMSMMISGFQFSQWVVTRMYALRLSLSVEFPNNEMGVWLERIHWFWLWFFEWL